MLAFLLVTACAAVEPAHRDERFVIHNQGNFTAGEVQRVRTQLEAGAAALSEYLGPAATRRSPVVVNLWAGAGVSHSHHGQGSIELYWVRERRAPIIHELTHVLAGYTASNGHWTQEGFASYMQDRYGEDIAFPTQRMAHGLVKALREDGRLLPMLEIMKDRDRATYFGLRTPWSRWLAYTQSTSFCQFLIERYGKERFFEIYDRSVETMDFTGLYGRTAEVLIAEWSSYVAALPSDTARARAVIQEMRALRAPTPR